jgi:hypothetical protein
MKIKFKIFKEMQKLAEIKWYHIVLGVISGSGMLVIIYLYKNYIFIFLNVLIGIESWICAYYTILFFILEIGNKLFDKIKIKKLNKKRFFDMNIFEIISLIISGMLILSYFITRHWIINNLICFCLAFTIMSFIILKSFILCFLFLFLYFIYDTFWVFYSEKVFKENLMDVAATSIQIPIKIEFPILFSNDPTSNCMILGLGDIILPGTVIKYCRRFDIIKNKNKIFFKGLSFYNYNLLLYIISVSIAMFMMFGFNHSQPVLFYISPIFIIGLFVKAYLNHCFLDFWKGLKIKRNKNKIINNKNSTDKDNEEKEDKKEELKEESEEEEGEEEEEEEEKEEIKKNDKIKNE